MTSTRDRIIETTAAMFMERGMPASGLKEIAVSSDATIGSLYHFFPGGKAELAAEVLRSSGRSYQALVEAIFDGAPDIVTGVAWCFEGAAATLEATDFADACPIATVALEVASTDESLRIVTAEVFTAWLGAARLRLVAAGLTDAAAGDLSVTLVAALEGGFLLSRAAKDASPLRTIGRQVCSLVEAALGEPRPPARRRRAAAERPSGGRAPVS